MDPISEFIGYFFVSGRTAPSFKLTIVSSRYYELGNLAYYKFCVHTLANCQLVMFNGRKSGRSMPASVYIS